MADAIMITLEELEVSVKGRESEREGRIGKVKVCTVYSRYGLEVAAMG